MAIPWLQPRLNMFRARTILSFIFLTLIAHHFEPSFPSASAYSSLSNDTLKIVSSHLSDTDFDIHTGPLLAPLLTPRVPGTKGHEQVETHLSSFFHDLNRDFSDTKSNTTPADNNTTSDSKIDALAQSIKWQISWQNSSSFTPLSRKNKIPFRNLILTLDPPGVPDGDVSRLVLSAHYDSKIEPEGFIGAIDSAAPCAMLMHVGRESGNALRRKWATELLKQNNGNETLSSMILQSGHGFLPQRQERGLQIVFLDGEEAFVQWTDDDSIYGARSLAATWEDTLHAAQSTFKTKLASIELFVLLDLLGSAGMSIPSYFPTTHWAYRRLSKLEQRMRQAGLFESAIPKNWQKREAQLQAWPWQQRGDDPATTTTTTSNEQKSYSWFRDRATSGAKIASTPSYQIGDDHTPFLARGVEILHLIPAPFPVVWHRIQDDGEHLDMPTVRDWARLMTGFVAEWTEVENVKLWRRKESTAGSGDVKD